MSHVPPRNGISNFTKPPLAQNAFKAGAGRVLGPLAEGRLPAPTPLVTSPRLTVVAQLPEAKVLLFGLNATHWT